MHCGFAIKKFKIVNDWSNWNDYDSAVDVYAFSIMAYEIVTGKVPYYELANVSPFVFANKVISGYCPKLSKDANST